MIKPPIVFIAGMLRAQRRGIDTDAWTWVSELAGQRLFYPPNVSGWDEERWLDTSTLRGRWTAAAVAIERDEADSSGGYDPTETAEVAVARALKYWGNPPLTKATRLELDRFAKRVEGAVAADWEESAYRGLRQNALRMLIATAPDSETC